MMTQTETRRHAAYWYAVGRHDAGDGPDMADEFSQFATAQAGEYYNARSSFLGSVHSQWREFVATLAHARNT